MKNDADGWQRVIGSSAESDRADEVAPDSASGPIERTTFFDEGCKLDGKLIIETSIQIDTEFRGAIECAETVTIGPEAAVEGRIRARSVFVLGAVKGDIEASREVVLHGAGRLHGDVKTPSFVIERGAFFSGHTLMYRPEIVARSAPAAPPDLPNRSS